MKSGLIMNQAYLPSGSSMLWILILLLALCSLGLIIYLLYSHQKCRMRCEMLERERDRLQEESHKARAWEALVPDLKKISNLDHDVNTPLCVVTMSLGRAKRLATDTGDESLLGNVQDILDAVHSIGEIMQAVRVLKRNPLIMKETAKARETGREHEN